MLEHYSHLDNRIFLLVKPYVKTLFTLNCSLNINALSTLLLKSYNLTIDDLSIAIYDLKAKTSPRKDGLLVDFFKVFKEIIIGTLVQV